MNLPEVFYIDMSGGNIPEELKRLFPQQYIEILNKKLETLNYCAPYEGEEPTRKYINKVEALERLFMKMFKKLNIDAEIGEGDDVTIEVIIKKLPLKESKNIMKKQGTKKPESKQITELKSLVEKIQKISGKKVVFKERSEKVVLKKESKEITSLKALVEKIQKLSGKKVVFQEKDNKQEIAKLVKLIEQKTGKKVVLRESEGKDKSEKIKELKTKIGSAHGDLAGAPDHMKRIMKKRITDLEKELKKLQENIKTSAITGPVKKK